jgi:hypothetical protein
MCENNIKMNLMEKKQVVMVDFERNTFSPCPMAVICVESRMKNVIPENQCVGIAL